MYIIWIVSIYLTPLHIVVVLRLLTALWLLSDLVGKTN